MDEMTTDDVFGPEVEKAKKPVEEVEQPEPEAKEEPKQEAPEPEPEQPKDKGETAPPPGEPQIPKGYVPLAAIEDERRKRQEWERKAQEFERQIQQAQQQTQHLPKQFLDDPDGTLQQYAVNVRTETSQIVMRSLHPDYDEMEAHFVKLAEQNPALQYRLQTEPNPAKFAYDTAKEDLELAPVREAGGLTKWQEKQREALRKEIEAELRAKAPPQPEVEAPPESLAAAPSNVSPKETFKKPSTNEVFN